MRAAGDPFVALRVMTYRPRLFSFRRQRSRSMRDYETDKVLAAVETALRDDFAFAAREFGQPVMLSEVIADDASRCRASSRWTSISSIAAAAPRLLQQRLLAELPVTVGRTANWPAAELLTLDPAPLDQLGVMA